ncbi:MAG: MBL fold metallo-hydrolase [Candidatus Micrarchaeia archaeon]|jgi:phosphoribosyl 1,2-cyclic phosphodiesterase
MELFFLGSGGGRVVLDRQMLATGGFRVNCKEFKMHCEPGPGALAKSFQYNQSPRDLDAIFCSHSHIDHCNDINVMIEAMTFGSWNKPRGTLIAAKSVLDGEGEFEKYVPEYFKHMLSTVKSLKAGQEYGFGKENGDAVLLATHARHEDPTAIGFVLRAEGASLGYTADTELFGGLWEQYEGCDCLVANCLRPDRDRFPFHLALDDVADGINSMKKKPSQVVFSHLGSKFLNAGPEAQKKKFEKATGIPAIIAHEGVKLAVERGKQKKL